MKKVKYETIINYLFFALLVPLTTGLVQFFLKSGLSIGGIVRAQGTFSHPNPFALFLVFFIGLTLWKIRTAKYKILWWVLLALEIFTLIATFSIGGIIMVVLVLITIGVNATSKKQRLVVGLLILMSVILFCTSEFGKYRLNEVANTGNVSEIVKTGRTSGGGSFAWRILNWNLFLKEWGHKPFLGYGLHTTGEIISPLGNIPHNDYLRFLVETGAIGFILYLYLLVILGRNIWNAYRGYLLTDLKLSYLALINFSIYIAWLIGSSGDNYITATVFQYYFWALTAIVLGMVRFQDKRICV